MKPGEVSIAENNVDNRLVVEVFGRQIDLHTILQKLEAALSDNSKIEEVRFIAGTIFNIDADLDKEVWHGRNIVVYAQEVIVCQPVHWNVSGKDSLHTYEQNAGTAEDGNGLNGKDGYPGESGGNVLIKADRIKCLGQLTISSNGGKGSNGQDGGNGADGNDGTGISRTEFDAKFPPICNIALMTDLRNTYRNLAAMSETVLEQWLQKNILFITTTYTSNALDFINSSTNIDIYDAFFKCITANRHRITFSYQSGVGIDNTQAFLLYEGSAGDPGKSGGEYGLGGEGGKPGEVNIVEGNRDVAANTNTKMGVDGVNGRGGVAGRQGKRGWDMAYMDYTLGRWSGSWPVYYGRDENSSLKLDYYRRSADDRVRCPYEKEYPYAGITVSRIENQNMATLEERNNSRSDSERQHHAKAVGKKTISTQRILNTYSEFMNTVEAEIKEEEQEKRAQEERLAAELKRQQQIEQEQARIAREEQFAARRAQELERQQQIEQERARRAQEEQLAALRVAELERQQHIEQEQARIAQEEQLIAERNSQEEDLQELSINRHVPFNPGSEHRKVQVKVSPLGKSDADERTFTKTDSLHLDDWLELNTFVLSCEDLRKLMVDFANVKTRVTGTTSQENTTKFGNLKKLLVDFTKIKASSTNKTSPENIIKIQTIDQIFTAKYKLAALHKTTHILGLDQSTNPRIHVHVQIAPKHLTESKTKDNLIGHAVLGTMKQYIFENTQEHRDIIAKYVEQMQNDEVSLQQAVKAFVLEAEYVELLNESLETLQKELQKPKHENIRQYWDGFNDKPLEDGVREMIERDKTLKIHYDRWNDMKRNILQYESDQTTCVEKEVKNKFIAHIRSKGNTSKSCRVLLAYLYDVNLRVYERDEDYELVLREDHNPSADTSNHILSRGNEFGQLKVNEEFLKLEQDRLHRDETYGKILREMDTLKSIEEVDNYLEKGCKLLENNLAGKADECYFDEKSAAVKIATFFPVEERDDMRQMLEKVTFEICNQKDILQHMLQRFSYEGKHITFNEMCFFINAVLDRFVDGGQEEYYFAWIVAAHSQRYWLDEVILMQLETYFKKQLTHKQQWREYMRKIDKEVLLEFSAELQSSVCSVECVGEILHLLSSVPIESVYFDGIPLSEWGYYLKEHYWTNTLRHVLEWDDDRSLGDATYYIQSLENTYGDAKAKDLLHKIKGKNREVTVAMVLDILMSLHKQIWKLSDEDIQWLQFCSLQKWMAHMEEKYKPVLEELKIAQLTEIIENDNISSTQLIKHLPGIQTSIHKIWNAQIVHNETSVALFAESEIKMWVKEFRAKLDNSSVEYSLQIYEEMLAVIDRAIELKKGFRLRDTQRLTVLILLTGDQSTLAQVSTGEGKSLIVVALSLIKALLREKVDIVTSSSVLAKRDSEVNNDIYGLFDITVSHNCSENIEQRKDAYSMHQVVYGDLASFQRDYLLDRFYGKNILGDRDFTNVIVDEVDSMLLDKGNNMLYLSHDIPGMDKLESVYIFIWQMVNNPNERPENIDTDMVKEEVLNSMYNTITLKDLGQLDTSLSVRRVNMIWNCLVDGGILNEEGHIISDAIDFKRLEEVLTPEVKQYNHRLSFLLKECVEREISVKVPNHLKKFVERHLESWIISAINALLMEPGQSYVVDNNKSGSKADRHSGIIILDNDTGADQGSSQWDEALHQFLQLKHGCKLSMQSLKAVFVSNVTYFKMYKLLYGLTGTLGSQRERTLLKEIHQVAFVTIPTAKSKQFEEYEPIISAGHRKWLESIKTETNKLINDEKRSVLIICDTINDADCIKNALKDNFAFIHPYTRDYQEFEIVQGSKQLPQGQIIIATNLAGRGTDIRITDGLKKAGGLHVMLTYLPENIRIEEQAFGRAARSGDKGSGRLIIMVSSIKQFKKSKIIDLKRKRDQNELHRISDIKTNYEKTISAEEICFDEFKKVYEMHRKNLDRADVPSEVKTILLQTCLDQWSFWLDEHNGLMEDIMSDADARNIPTVLKKFLAKLSKFGTGVDGDYFDSNCWQDWVTGNPMRMVRLANYLSEFHVKKSRMEEITKCAKKVVNFVKENICNIEKDVKYAYETAMSLYGDVIQNEPQFSEAAYYYRAYTLMKTIEWEEKTQSRTDKQKFEDFEKDLREAVRLFEGHCAVSMQAATIVDKLKGNHFWYEDYKAQKESICQMYQSFIRSIEDIFGHAITAKTFKTKEIKENLSEHIFTKLLNQGVIARPKVHKTISERQLYSIHKDYGISIEALRAFFKKHSGPIDVEKFLEELRESFPLPSREQFWEILIDQKVVHSVKRYVLVDTAKLEVEDPSLMDALNAKVLNKTLVKEAIELDNDQIVLYHDLLTVNDAENDSSDTENDDPKASHSVDIFEKDHFITLIGREKFVMFIKKGIVRCNEKANIDKSMMASCKFSSFDSISVEDIASKANVAIEEVKLIIEELVSQQILVRNGDSYVMTEELSSSDRDLLPTYPLYESSIRAILASCFAYRLALSNIKEQLEAKERVLRIQLKCNPYPGLFQDLLNQNIIRPMVVKEANLKEKLDEIFQVKLFENFNFNSYRQQMVPLLSESLYISTTDSERLYDLISGRMYDTLPTMCKLANKLYDRTITSIQTFTGMGEQMHASDEKSKPDTNVQFVPVHQVPDLLLYDMRKTVEIFLAQQKLFSQTETKNHTESVLKQIKPSLVGLKVPTIHLKSIQEATKLIENNYGNIDELQLFSLNGLPCLLHLLEKRWSKEMLINVGLVVGIGVAQIVVGALIEIWSAGLMTHVASGLMSEGVSDIMYAVNSYKSGHFSWENYWSEKWKSVLFTAATAGVAAYVSRGTKVSRIANKVSGPGLAKDGKEIAKMTGRSMINEIGGKKVFQETVKRIVMKTTQGFAQGIASVMVDKFTEDYLQSLIESIAADMLGQIVSKVDDHKISANLKKVYDELGEEQARKLVLQLPAFGSNDWDTCVSYTKQITFSLSQGFASAMQKTHNQTRPLKILSNISTAWVWTERAIEIGKLTTVVGTFLDNLDNKMNEKFKTMVQSASVSENSQPNESSNFDQFKAEIVKEWKMQLTEHVGRIILQHLIKPLLNDALYRVGKFIKRIPRNIRQRVLKRRMRKMQKEHAQLMDDSNLSQETKTILKQEYHEKLLKIMYKTKSPTLFADIIKENVPMDLTCAAACTPLVQALLTKMGHSVDGIAVTIKGENGIEQTFCSGSIDGDNARKVVLQLKDNHFTFSDNQVNTSDNNCFYAALSEAIPELKNIDAKEFRENIADTIRHDPDVQYRIRQGWHRFPIKKYNAVGGRSLPLDEKPKRVKTFRQQERKPAIPRASGADRLKTLAVELENHTPPENCPTAKSAALHLYARLTIYDFEFAGLLQGIAAKTGIPLEDLMKEGASNCKDDLKLVKGGNIHRAHTIRGKVNEDALKEHPEELAKLKQYAGHREYVCKEANQFDKIGGDIDKQQWKWITHLAKTHDFSKKPTDQDKSNMRKHLNEAVKVLAVKSTSSNKENQKYNATMMEQMQIAKEMVRNVDLEKLYECGQHGYKNV